MFRQIRTLLNSNCSDRFIQICLVAILFAGLLLLHANPSQAQSRQVRNGLAPCTTDSFVRQAGAAAEQIYGDESQGRGEQNGGPPPYMGYTAQHRIGSGIVGQRAAGLTTGHGSYLPSAVGADEFVGNEWSFSGAGSASQQAPNNTYSQTRPNLNAATTSNTASVATEDSGF